MARNERLRSAIFGRRLRIIDVAGELQVDPKTVERWIANSSRIPFPRHRAALARLLQVDESELWPDAEERQPRSLAPDPDFYDWISQVVDHPRRVDQGAVTWLERCLDEHRQVEDQVGSGPLLGVVRAQLSTVTGLAREARGPIGRQLVRLAAQYAQFYAWLCNDAGDKAAAFAWYERAHAMAVEAGDVNIAASTFSQRAHLAWSVGDADRTVRLGEAARWHEGHTTPGVRGMAAQMVARGHALAGQPDDAHRSLDEAEVLVAEASSKPDDEPECLYFYDDVWLTLQRGMIETQLGNGDRAVNLLSDALAQVSSHYRRDRAWYSSCLARAHVAAGDLDAAADVSVATAPDAVALNRYALAELRTVAELVSPRAATQGHQITEALPNREPDGD
jgi:hypothetical protein